MTIGRIGNGTWEPYLVHFPGGDALPVSVAAARRRAGFVFRAPSTDPLTPARSIRKVWLVPRRPDGGAKVVAIEYDHLQILEQRMPAAYNGPRAYRGIAADHADPGGHVGVVQGLTAYIAPPNTHCGKHPGYVLYQREGVQITVEGYFTAAQLTGIADLT